MDMLTDIEKLCHMDSREILWETLKEQLKITFDEPCNEDEMCRVLLDGYGVDIVHFPEDHTEEIREELLKLCACNVYVVRESVVENDGSLRYMGDNVFLVRWTDGKLTFPLSKVEKIDGFYIYLRDK